MEKYYKLLASKTTNEQLERHYKALLISENAFIRKCIIDDNLSNIDLLKEVMLSQEEEHVKMYVIKQVAKDTNLMKSWLLQFHSLSLEIKKQLVNIVCKDNEEIAKELLHADISETVKEYIFSLIKDENFANSFILSYNFCTDSFFKKVFSSVTSEVVAINEITSRPDLSLLYIMHNSICDNVYKHFIQYDNFKKLPSILAKIVLEHFYDSDIFDDFLLAHAEEFSKQFFYVLSNNATKYEVLKAQYKVLKKYLTKDQKNSISLDLLRLKLK